MRPIRKGRQNQHPANMSKADEPDFQLCVLLEASSCCCELQQQREDGSSRQRWPVATCCALPRQTEVLPLADKESPSVSFHTVPRERKAATL